MKVNIFNRSKRRNINRKKLSHIIKNTIRQERHKFDQVNIIITTDRHMQALNKQFLSRNRTTNVIAFDLGSMAEVYVSSEQAPKPYDLYFYVVHGLLHICGYNDQSVSDQKIMNRRTAQLLDNA